MSSIKKRSKVRRMLRTMFGEANVRPVKNGLHARSRLAFWVVIDGTEAKEGAAGPGKANERM